MVGVENEPPDFRVGDGELEGRRLCEQEKDRFPCSGDSTMWLGLVVCDKEADARLTFDSCAKQLEPTEKVVVVQPLAVPAQRSHHQVARASEMNACSPGRASTDARLAAPVEVGAEVGVEVNSAESRQALVAMDNPAHLAAACPVVVFQPEEEESLASRGQRTAAGRMRSAWFWAVPLCLVTCGKIQTA